MAVPRVFISSTCYDLKYIRENLKYFIKRLGYEPVLSEEGSIFFDPSLHTHDACIAEIPNCQMFVLIIGGRFGSQFKGEIHSITNAEYREAVRLKIPIFALVEQAVDNDSKVYFHNKESGTINIKSIIYPSSDSVLIFDFIEEVRSNAVNNAIVPFKDFNDIESYLLQQWAGMVYSFLTRENENARVADTLEMLREMNERIEILSRQILRSVGTDEAKITAELYDVINSVKDMLFIRIYKDKISPKSILENENIEKFYSALGYKCELDGGTVVIYSGNNVIGRYTHSRYPERYVNLRNKLIDVLKDNGITPEEYISGNLDKIKNN